MSFKMTNWTGPTFGEALVSPHGTIEIHRGKGSASFVTHLHFAVGAPQAQRGH